MGKKKEQKHRARQFVKDMARMMKGQSKIGDAYYKWILEEGKSFKGSELHEVRMQKKQCYYNSQALAISGEGFDYYDGWGITGLGIPMEHGFNVKDGGVVDATWNDGEDYFGVKIPSDYIAKFWLKNEVAEKLLFHYFKDEVYKKDGD